MESGVGGNKEQQLRSPVLMMREEEGAMADAHGGPSLEEGSIHEEGGGGEEGRDWPLGSEEGQSHEGVESWGKKRPED